MSVDCQPVAESDALPLPLSAAMTLELGKFDAHPIDGTFDDVVIRPREPDER